MGEFDLLEAFYGLATTVFIFVAEIDLDLYIRELAKKEKLEGSTYATHPEKERTKQLQELVALLFGAIPIFLYIFVGQFFQYNDPLWIPFLIAVPSTIFSLIFALQLCISKSSANGKIFATLRYDSDRLSIVTFVLPLVFVVVSTGIVVAKVGSRLHNQGFLDFEFLFPLFSFFVLLAIVNSKIFVYDESNVNPTKVANTK